MSEIRGRGGTGAGHTERRDVVHAGGQGSYVSRSARRISGILPNAVDGNPILPVRGVKRVSDSPSRSGGGRIENGSSKDEDVPVGILGESSLAVREPPIVGRCEIRLGSEAGNGIVAGSAANGVFHFPIGLSGIRTNKLRSVRIEVPRGIGNYRQVSVRHRTVPHPSRSQGLVH